MTRPWWQEIGRSALPQSRQLAVVVLLSLVGIGLGLLAPWPLKLIVDHVLTDVPLPAAVRSIEALPGAGSPRGVLAWLALATVGIFLARQLTKILTLYLQTGASARMVFNLATELFSSLQRRSLLYHGEQRTGDLVKRVTSDTRCVRELVIDVCLPVLTSLLTLAGMFVVMWTLDPGLALLALFVSVPLGLLSRFFAGRMSERSFTERELQGDMSALAEQTLAALPAVKAFTRERVEEERFRTLADRTVRASLASLTTQLQFQASSSGVSQAAAATVMTVGGFQVLGGELTVGSLLVLMSYFAQLFAPIETLSYLTQGYSSAAAGARRVLQVLHADDDGMVESSSARPLPSAPTGASIRFDAVTFGYRPGEAVLRDVDLDVAPGETLALAGRTGTGKSTLVSLISRLHDPWEGAVSVNGCDVREVELESLRRSVAIVLQEPFLLPLSIAENISYGRPGASFASILEAARAAHVDRFVDDLPDGYDTILGERGATLSGGERQRIAIARALLMDAPILVLDEPTSAVDAETEASLIGALEKLREGRTTIVIAHRLSTLQMADRIVVLAGGSIVESGSHRSLAAAGGLYATLLGEAYGTASTAGWTADG